MTQTKIAQLIGCSQPTISYVLSEFQDTRHLARAILHRDAHKFAQRIVDDANVEESLEVLDRLDVAAKRQESKGHTISIVVAMPGQGQMRPPAIDLIALSPSQKQLGSESEENP
jgi:predicted transcriptional regulator